MAKSTIISNTAKIANVQKRDLLYLSTAIIKALDPSLTSQDGSGIYDLDKYIDDIKLAVSQLENLNKEAKQAGCNLVQIVG